MELEWYVCMVTVEINLVGVSLAKLERWNKLGCFGLHDESGSRIP